MAFSYSGDPSTSNKDEVRFLIQDTDAQDPLLQDEEINFLLNQNNDQTKIAAIKAAEVISSQFSRLADTTIGDFSIKHSQRAQTFMQLAEQLRDQAGKTRVKPFAGGISKSDKTAVEGDTDRVKPSFKKGKFDFPTASDDF